MIFDKVAGLCGSFNGNQTDDVVTSSGFISDNFDDIASSFQVGTCDEILPPSALCGLQFIGEYEE